MKKKVVFIQNVILHYRKAFYNQLSTKYNVVIIHSGDRTIKDGDLYSEIIIPVKNVGCFKLQVGLKHAIDFQSPNYVVAMFDIRWINTIKLFLSKKHFNFLWWGLDTGKSTTATKIKLLIAKAKYPIVFYNHANKVKFLHMGLKDSNLFVANNTFDVGTRQESYKSNVKDIILFTGSFDRRKMLDVLIDAFSKAKPNIPDKVKLVLIGDGEVGKELKNQARKLLLENDIIFTGRINDPSLLANYYDRSICSVSYGQAGLSVLQSLGFGVPFIAKEDAISGGEISNIIDGFNGFFCADPESLVLQIEKLSNDESLARLMGKQAYEYYTEHCTIQNMVDGFINAFEN